jgi:hypothetical protein
VRMPIQAHAVDRTSSGTSSPPKGILPSDDWDCYSARRCTGKIINHKDPHNCKNSGGKSDFNNRTGQCTVW